VVVHRIRGEHLFRHMTGSRCGCLKHFFFSPLCATSDRGDYLRWQKTSGIDCSIAEPTQHDFGFLTNSLSPHRLTR
jgi:hypothetical protein